MEFEAEAAMRLEACAKGIEEKPYPLKIEKESLPWRISFNPTIEAIWKQKEQGISVEKIATRFHQTLIKAITTIAQEARKEFGLTQVVLGGGVFLNRWLTAGSTEALHQANFKVLRPRRYSPNDESLSLGQIYHGLAKLTKEGKI